LKRWAGGIETAGRNPLPFLGMEKGNFGGEIRKAIKKGILKVFRTRSSPRCRKKRKRRGSGTKRLGRKKVRTQKVGGKKRGQLVRSKGPPDWSFRGTCSPENPQATSSF